MDTHSLTEMATYTPKSKAAKEKELTSLQRKMAEKKQELEEQMRELVLAEYDERVKAGKKEEADALRHEYPKHFLLSKDHKGIYHRWKKAVTKRSQCQEALSDVMEKVVKLQDDIDSKEEEIKTLRQLISTDKKTMEFCSGMVYGFETLSKSIDECEASVTETAVKKYRSLKEKKIEVKKESQELEISAMMSDTNATDEEGILSCFVILIYTVSKVLLFIRC